MSVPLHKQLNGKIDLKQLRHAVAAADYGSFRSNRRQRARTPRGSGAILNVGGFPRSAFPSIPHHQNAGLHPADCGSPL